MAASVVSINVHDHGLALDEKKKRIQCKYCNKVVSGFFRLKCHLGGITGDVSPCEEVPVNVKEVMKNKLLEKKLGTMRKEVGELNDSSILPRKRSWCIDPNSVNHEITDTETAVNSKEDMNLSSKHEKKCIGSFFYKASIDLDISRPTSERMLNAEVCYPRIVKEIPSGEELRGRIPEEELKEMQQYVNDIRNSWASTGCSIVLDGWIDKKGRNLVNILVDCPKGPMYLCSSDISASIADGNALQSLIDGVLDEVGVENVVQIVTYSTSSCMEVVGKLLMEKHSTVFWTVSASHCMELILEKIELMGSVKTILDKATTITEFFHSNAKILKFMRNYAEGHNLVKSSKFRLAKLFLNLEKIVLEKKNLESMFMSNEWKTSILGSSREGNMVADLVGDPSFWSEAMKVLKATIPVVRALCLINEADKPLIGYIYETMDQVKETIQKGFKYKKAEYVPYWQVIDGVWNNHLHSPLHAAGYFFNPSFYYLNGFYVDAEVTSGLLCCVLRMVQDCSLQNIISRQIDEYREAKGAFEQGGAIDLGTNIPAALWWSNYGGQCPELQRLAIRILSQTCDGALRYGLKRSLVEKLLDNGRNPIEQQRLSDLTFVHYNHQLRRFEPGRDGKIWAEEIDSMDD